MKELVPIKVKIGLRANGHADHPDWYKLPLAAAENPASHMPHGWVYDKSSGHKTERMGGDWESPFGMQWGCLLVTEKFAQEAVITFPDLVTVITETVFEDFYDNYSRVHMPNEKYDLKTLEGLKLEHDLRIVLGQDVTEVKQRMSKAIDINDPSPGIIKQRGKTWADTKVQKGIIIERNNREE